MEPTRLLVTGFGAFEAVEDNPSGALARALDGERGVVGVLLPVTFRGSAEAFDAALDGMEQRPEVILCSGVHPGSEFRLERRAGAHLGSDRVDNEGETGDVVSGSMGGGEGYLSTDLDLEALAEVMRAGGASNVRVSKDAGGYVCERIYRHALVRGGELGIPTLFLHVPPLGVQSVREQLPPVRALVEALVVGVV